MPTIVVSCAGSKSGNAGSMQDGDGRDIRFVGDPDAAPRPADCVYARPDDLSDDGRSWRVRLREYNEQWRGSSTNPWGLLRAFELYEPKRKQYRTVYRDLVAQFGVANVFILSAGWGLIPADYLTPVYDITFSMDCRIASFKRRPAGGFRDDNMLSINLPSPVCFIGGEDYRPTFVRLTEAVPVPRIVFYNSKRAPVAPGCIVRRFTPPSSKESRGWQYACARDLIAGRLDLSIAIGERGGGGSMRGRGGGG